MSTFQIKRNDRLPSLTATLKQGVGTTSEAAIDLTTATSVKFIMKDAQTPGGTAKVAAAAVVVTPASGTVKYNWAAGDTDTPGTFSCEWEITFPGPLLQTVPSSSYDTVKIDVDLG